jgi:hypothetical protein
MCISALITPISTEDAHAHASCGLPTHFIVKVPLPLDAFNRSLTGTGIKALLANYLKDLLADETLAAVAPFSKDVRLRAIAAKALIEGNECVRVAVFQATGLKDGVVWAFPTSLGADRILKRGMPCLGPLHNLYSTQTLKFRSLGNSKGARIEVETIDRDDGSIVLHIARGENSANDFSALLRLFFDEMRKLPLQQLARFLGDKGARVLKASPTESEVPPFEAFERLSEMMHLLLAYPTKNVVLVAPGPDAPPEGALVEIAFGYFMDEPVELPGFAHGAPPEERVNIHTTTVVISDTEPLNYIFDKYGQR